MFTVAKHSGSTGEELWRTTITASMVISGIATAVDVDSSGDVIAIGSLVREDFTPQFTVVKLNGTTGREQWRKVIAGGAGDRGAWTVALDSAGDVIAGGSINSGGSTAFFVIKLSNLNGSEIWRKVIVGDRGTNQAYALTIDSTGDVIAAGMLSNTLRNTDVFVGKFSGATGTTRWIYRSHTSGFENDNGAVSVALDPTGDIVIAGWRTNAARDMFVAKLSKGSGGELWSTTIDGGAGDGDQANSVVVDGAGNVVAGGTFGRGLGFGSEFVVIKFAGESGAELWRHLVKGSADYSDQAYAVGIDASDDVMAVGTTQNLVTSQDITAVKLARSTGEEVWRTDVSGTYPGKWPGGSNEDYARLMKIDSCQNVVVAGTTKNVHGIGDGIDFTVLKLSGLSGNNAQEFKTGVCTSPHPLISLQGSVECTSPSGGEVSLDGSTSSDSDSSPGTNDDIEKHEWFGDYGQVTQRLLGTGPVLVTTLALGVHTVTLKVTDTVGLSNTAQAILTVVDATPPVVMCPEVGPVECSAPGGSFVALLSTATDACSSTLVIANSRTGGGGDASGLYPLGITGLTFTATDGSGNAASCTSSVQVRDTTPPSLTLTLSPTTLWPLNHRMVPVQASWRVSDICDPTAGVVLASATSSEADDASGSGDGNTPEDIQDASIGTPDARVLLRAERSGHGQGRVYTLTYATMDGSGNSASALGVVTVPNDLGTGRRP